jgi:hypothetical protein
LAAKNPFRLAIRVIRGYVFSHGLNRIERLQVGWVAARLSRQWHAKRGPFVFPVLAKAA